MFAFGLLTEQIAKDPTYLSGVENLLGQHIFPEIDFNNTENAVMKARACWVYGRYAPLIQWENTEHQTHVLNSLYQNLSANIDLPVRVNSAIALIHMLTHE